jgi:hypothetical protein
MHCAAQNSLQSHRFDFVVRRLQYFALVAYDTEFLERSDELDDLGRLNLPAHADQWSFN